MYFAALSIVELGICIVSMRGSILATTERSSMQYWLYIRLSKTTRLVRDSSES